MEQISIYTEQFLAYFNVDSSHTLFNNTVGDYTFAFTIFLLGLVIFGLTQFFALSWLAQISKKTKTDLDDVFVKIIKSFKPPFYLFLSFWFAIRFIDVYGTADKVLTAILVLWFVYQAVVIAGILVEDVVFRHFAKDQDETTKSAIKLISNLVKGILWVVGILLVLSNFGINVTSLMAGAGIAGIAIAFALQGILSDLFSSFSLYFDKPFRVGDFIKMGDSRGTVKQIGIKSTRLESFTGEEIVLSNQELTSAKIQNYGIMEERRGDLHFGVLYETKKEQLVKIPHIVKNIVDSIEEVRFDRAHFKGYGDSSLDFEVVYYVLSPEYEVFMDKQQEINIALFEKFASEGIGFAYPTRTVYIEKGE
jgi:small-conductance mechanosensitive channel